MEKPPYKRGLLPSRTISEKLKSLRIKPLQRWSQIIREAVYRLHLTLIKQIGAWREDVNSSAREKKISTIFY
jgi:hypothetical protein